MEKLFSHKKLVCLYENLSLVQQQKIYCNSFCSVLFEEHKIYLCFPLLQYSAASFQQNHCKHLVNDIFTAETLC